MTPAEITAAASEYMTGFDDHEPIIAIAQRGTSEEDDSRLEEAYGEEWAAVALEVQRQCRHHHPTTAPSGQEDVA